MFESLPEDIIIIISRQLDIVSLYNFQTVYDRVREIISRYRIIEICDISSNTLSSVESLKSLFFKDISRHLQELNVSGINDLYKSSLLPVMNSLKCLKSLDVSYTNITMNDFVELYQKCKTIKSIKINFKFGIGITKRVMKEMLLKCQEVFKNLDDVHFVGNLSNLVYSELSYFILSKSRLNNLQYTVIKCSTTTYENEDCKEKVLFNTFTMNIYNDNNSNEALGNMRNMLIFNKLNFEDYEVLVIWQTKMNLRTMYVTSGIGTVFRQNFLDLRLLNITDFSVALCGNAYVMLWNKNTTIFDEDFYESLSKKMKPFFPYEFETLKNKQVPLNYDWFYTNPQLPNRCNVARPSPKRIRLVDSSYNLDYSEQFQQNSTIQLSLCTNSNIGSLTLSTSNDYLKKITYLSLSGQVRYSNDFFRVLFGCCDKLVTLNVEATPVCPCFVLISKYISLSQTLKNLRIADSYINFEFLFSSLGACKSLENIHICDQSSTLHLSDPLPMFLKCDKLHWLAVYGNISDTNHQRKLQILKSARLKCQKSHIRINLLNHKNFSYVPSLGVFQLNPLQPK